MAIRDNGKGDLVGFTHDHRIFLIDKANGSTIDTFNMYLEGSPYIIYEYGDMTVGPLVFCTRTIGYWMNHSWDDATVTICGGPVDQELVDTILWNARGNNFSMFFAQLIAAKLNCNDYVGIAAIDDAEQWLCNQEIGIGDWNSEFASKQPLIGKTQIPSTTSTSAIKRIFRGRPFE